jgi:NADH dehydrogenase (ubiquinone) 1 alpha subcomplex subunit 8
MSVNPALRRMEMQEADDACTLGAASVLEDVNKTCLEEFRKHWECLDNNNQQLWQCRKWERPLNACVFEKLVRFTPPVNSGLLDPKLTYLFPTQHLEKKIPGVPEGETPVHMKKSQIFAHSIATQ